MLNRRQTLATLGAFAMTTVATRPLWAAPIKIDDTSALLVIDGLAWRAVATMFDRERLIIGTR